MSEALDKLNIVIDFLNKNEEAEAPLVLEVPLMTPDSLNELFSHRPIVIPSDKDSWVTPFTSADKDVEFERCTDDLVGFNF